jgi:beta-phosphoglucomutase-like phosphatase (HAD superfamily)
MLSAVFFELEGVLADLRVARLKGLATALGAEGIILTENEFDARCAGVPVRAALHHAAAAHGIPADDTAIDLLVHAASEITMEQLGKGFSLTDGAATLVNALQGRTRLAVVTRASRREVELILSMSGLADAFETIVCDEDAFPPKPAAAPYVEALARLDRRRPLRRDGIVALEDGAIGIRSAHGAGVRCMVVGNLPAHVALDADAMTESLTGHSLDTLGALLAPSGELLR